MDQKVWSRSKHLAMRIVYIGQCQQSFVEMKLRVRTFIELCLYRDKYLNNSYLKELTGLDDYMENLLGGNFDLSSKTKGKPKSERQREGFEAGIVDNMPGTYSTMWHIFALSNILGFPIQTVYPHMYCGHTRGMSTFMVGHQTILFHCYHYPQWVQLNHQLLPKAQYPKNQRKDLKVHPAYHLLHLRNRSTRDHFYTSQASPARGPSSGHASLQ